MRIDKLDKYEKNETDAEIILIMIWDDLGNMKESDQLNCKYCKKIFEYLNQRFS